MKSDDTDTDRALAAQERLMSVPEAATALGVSVSTVRRLIRYRYIGATRVGRSVRIVPSELARYITESTRAAI